MSRAFVTESFGWNVCTDRNRECRHADLRGACELEVCVYADEEKPGREKQDTRF